MAPPPQHQWFQPNQLDEHDDDGDDNDTHFRPIWPLLASRIQTIKMTIFGDNNMNVEKPYLSENNKTRQSVADLKRKSLYQFGFINTEICRQLSARDGHVYVQFAELR